MTEADLLNFIPPTRIRARLQFMNAFGKAEAEYAAASLVLFTQERSPLGWEAVPVAGLIEWLRANQSSLTANPFVDFAVGFYFLKSGGFIVSVAGRFEVTGEFVLRCFLSGHGLIGPLTRAAVAMSANPAFVRAHLPGRSAREGVRGLS